MNTRTNNKVLTLVRAFVVITGCLEYGERTVRQNAELKMTTTLNYIFTNV